MVLPNDSNRERGQQMTKLLTTTEVSKLTGFSLQKIIRLIDCGKLPAIDTSTNDKPRWSIRQSDLEAFLTPVNVKKPEFDVDAV